MIGEFNYDQMRKFSKELKENAEIIEQLTAMKGNDLLKDFVSDVERYVTFINSTISMYEEADEALSELR